MVFDNLNVTKKARDHTDAQKNKHHDVVHGMAVVDRVTFDIGGKPRKKILEVPNEKWLLSPEEFQTYVRSPCKEIIKRILCEHMAFFKKKFSGFVCDHIPHEFQKEMSKKSKMVRLNNDCLLP